MDDVFFMPIAAVLVWLLAISVVCAIFSLTGKSDDCMEPDFEPDSTASVQRFSCHSCGSLLPEAFGTVRQRSHPYCEDCVTPAGELKPYPAVLSATTVMLRSKGRSDRQAEEAARHYLRRMPAWAKR